MGFPKMLQEFQATFPDEETCWEALRQARWPEGFVCPRCGHTSSSWISTRRLEQCCRFRYQYSVTAGTVFHRTRIPLLSWFAERKDKRPITGSYVKSPMGTG